MLNWSYKNDVRGVQIFDSSLEYGFISLNDGRPTRVTLSNNTLQKSSPDITFSSSDIAVHLRWEVTNENLGSDHLIIKICLNWHCWQNICFKKRNYKTADWKMYKKIIEKQFLSQPNMVELQEKYDIFISQVNNAATKSIPMIKICNDPQYKFKPKSYWNPSLSRAVAKRRLALRKFRKNPTPENLDFFKNQVAETQRLIRQAKSQSWKEFCSGIDEGTSCSGMWRKMRWVKSVRQNNTGIPYNKKKELLCKLAPDSVLNQMPNITSANTVLESPFHLGELNKCLKKKDTAAGVDQISYSMLYNLPDNAKLYLLDIYNCIFRTAIIPHQWRDILILPIPKAQSNFLEPKIRPISLISCVCKIFHTMVARRLEWYVEKHNIISCKTVGFRRSQSCFDSLTRLICHIQIAFTKNLSTLACFLDIENAYNTILIESVVASLDEINVGSRICKYVWEFLSQRCLIINEVNGDSNWQIKRWTNRGLAQGDPISPLLFNIVTHKICHVVQNVMISQYADDFVLYISNRDLKASSFYMQNSLNDILLMLQKLGLELSGEKTKYCIFSRGHKTQRISINIDNKQVNFEENIKYLGIWLDKSLRWGKHISDICGKTQKYLNILKTLAGPSWGVHPKYIRRIYIAVIRSRLDYGCFFYHSAAKVHLEKLNKIQNQALRVIGSFIKSTPIHTMECELSVPPLFIRRTFLGLKFCLKCKSRNNLTINLISDLSDLRCNRYWLNKTKPLLATLFEETKQENIAASSSPGLYSLETWASNVDFEILSDFGTIRHPKNSYEVNTLKTIILQELNIKYTGWYQIYTDGSKCINGLGAGVYDSVRNHKIYIKIKACVSIMTVELVAILEALKYAKTVDYSRIVIFSDSKSALQHIARCTSGFRGVSTAYAILREISDLRTSNRDLILQWVPSHIGLRGNEEADCVAKRAVTDGTDFYIVPDYVEVLPKVKIKLNYMWKQYFDERSKQKGIWYRTMLSEPPRIPWFNECNFSRQLIVLAFRIRSGHIPLNSFAYLMNKNNSPNCERCSKVEDIYHILLECTQNKREREALFARRRINTLQVGVIQSILSRPVSDSAFDIYKFVRSSLEQRCLSLSS